MDEHTKAENSNSALIPVSQNSRASAPASQDLSSDGRSPDTESPHEGTGSSPLPRRATGPRTKAGKRKSRYNAVKKGLFAKATLLDGESVAQYEGLRKGLWEEFQPESPSEMEDVEYLVSLYWRRRRIAKAENAEIENLVNFKTCASHHAPMGRVWDQSRTGETAGGISQDRKETLVLRHAIDMLVIFRDSLERYGFHADEDPWLRTQLYERYHNDQTLKKLPGHSESPSKCDMELETENKLSQDEFMTEMLTVLRDEIEQLEIDEVWKALNVNKTTEYDTISALIPFRDLMDAIIRVQAHTSREIERTQNRLECARRRRQGQPEPPTLRLKLEE